MEVASNSSRVRVSRKMNSWFGSEEFVELARGDEHFHVMSLTLREAESERRSCRFRFFRKPRPECRSVRRSRIGIRRYERPKIDASPGTGVVFKEGAPSLSRH